MDEYLKNSAELNKIVGYEERKSPVPPSPHPRPKTPSLPPRPAPTAPPAPKDNQPVIWSSRFAGCHSLETAKKYLQEYYQKTKVKLSKIRTFPAE
ncbi:MAG: hypothetical protein I3273_00050 [Candidatus Moeniiplasma glomeromycotorum]|nr:hypothetical protein [Candidatus Moeniiplasma glomeromycotorum]